MVNLGIIGCGYWGPNLLRNFATHPKACVKKVIDLDTSRLHYVREKYPEVITSRDYHDLWCDEIDAVAIATSPTTHYTFAKEALLQNKHVLVEKPLAMSTEEGFELCQLAKERKLKLMVGHTFEYNEAVRELKHQIKKGTVGKPYYFCGQRVNFGIVRKDVNSLWNLAPHDVSILIYLMDAMPTAVSAKGFDFIQEGIPDVTFMVLHFPDDVVAHVQVSWLDPNKQRRMTVVGSEKMIVYDDMSDSKLKIYDKGIKKQNIDDSFGPYDDFGKYQLIKHAGDVTMPSINFSEPLKEECHHFINCILNDQEPLTNGENGLRVVQVLEAAQKSILENGTNIEISNDSTRQFKTTIPVN